MQTLLLNQDSRIADAIQQVLRERKHTTVQASNESEAWTIFQRDHPPLVVLAGINKQAMSLCRQIRSRPSGEFTVVLAVLFPYNQEQLNAVLHAGADECIIGALEQKERLHARVAFTEQQAANKQRRQQAETQLQVSEAKAQAIIDTTVEAIITINPRGIIQSFNQAAEKMFGFSAGEAIGQNVSILMPSPYREEHNGYIRSYLETGKRRIIGIGREVVGRRKNGSTFPMHLSVSEVKLNDNLVFAGIVRDISEQRRLEQKILRISEQERRRIGQDLHDGLGQMLSGIGLLIEDLIQRLEQTDSPLTAQATKIMHRIREADQYTDSLVRGLVPVDVDEKGLVEALKRLTSNMEDLFNIEFTFKPQGLTTITDATVASHFYRIAQEAVNNAVKHGRATKVAITLAAGQQKIRLRIEDNGVGFSQDLRPYTPQAPADGLGLHIMEYRARIIGATLDIRSNPRGGTIVTCTLPRHVIKERAGTNNTS